MKRNYISELKPNQEILIRGRIHEIRDLAKVKFLLIRDLTGVVQCVSKNKDVNISNLTLESVVEIFGKTKKSEVKSEFSRKDLEIEISKINILDLAGELPIHINEKTTSTNFDKRLDYRSLDVRKPKVKAIFKIQSSIINGFREFFYDQGFIEIQPPGIIATSTEGGTDLFEVNYFGKKAYLAQSPQLYKQLMAISLEKVFFTGPLWRAEKHDTTKHINEIRQMDIECSFNDDQEIMVWLEKVITYMVKKVIKDCSEELRLLGLSLEIPKTKYLKYAEAVKLLFKHKINIKEGDDFEPEAERKLCSLFPNTLIFTYDWPSELKPFYIWTKNREKGISGGFDVLFGGVEISSGGQRVHISDILEKQIISKKLNPKDFEWYIDAFRYGSPIHSGWSIGLERFTMALLRLQNIRESTLFPRDRNRLVP